MGTEFEECLRRGRLKEFPPGEAIVPKEVETAESDFNDAKDSFGDEKYKWATIQAYYSMFHVGRALIYDMRYREKGHFALIVAIDELYVKQRLLPKKFLEGLQNAKNLRENADYYDRWSKEAARAILILAEEFLVVTKKIIGK